MANKNKIRKVPQQAIADDYAKYKEKLEIDFVEEDQVYRVTLYPFFEPVRINEVIESFGKDIQEMNKKDIDFPEKMIPQLLIYHCVKEFSDLPLTNSKDVKKRISFFYQFINTRYYKEVTDQMLQSEVEKVWSRLMEQLAESQKLERAINKAKERIQNLDLQSAELSERIQGIQKEMEDN